jgi:hypothetical protein
MLRSVSEPLLARELARQTCWAGLPLFLMLAEVRQSHSLLPQNYKPWISKIAWSHAVEARHLAPARRVDTRRTPVACQVRLT